MKYCVPTTKWKYLRETDKKFFDPKMNTTLKEYLQAIYPEDFINFEFGSSILKSDVPEGFEYHRYVCDAICRKLKIVVEFDGHDHYQSTKTCINDLKRDRWFESIGYKTIRIPYWIQLSRNVVYELFRVDVEESLCELDCSFYSPEKQSAYIDSLPGNMCELGRYRFVKEFNSLSASIRRQIYKDLDIACSYAETNLGLDKEFTWPSYIKSQMDMYF